MPNTASLALLLGAALLITGCVGFKANELPVTNFDSMQPPPAQKTKVFSQWYWRSSQSMSSPAADAGIKQRFDRALSDSGCCTLVDSAAEADVVVKGTSYHEPNPAAGIAAAISGFTFTAIPFWATLKVHLAADASNGTSSRSYDLRDSATMAVWLPLIVAMPFAENPIKAEREIDENAYRTLIWRMQQDGLFDVRPQPAQSALTSAGPETD